MENGIVVVYKYFVISLCMIKLSGHEAVKVIFIKNT